MRRVSVSYVSKALVLGMSVTVSTTAFAAGGSVWLSHGYDSSNTRNQENEKVLDVHNVHALAVKWHFETVGPVSATPAVDNDKVYFPDFAGNLFAVDRETG